MKQLKDYPNHGWGYEGFWAFLRERYQILLRREAGEPGPWTTDPVLQAWRFCNVRREDDRVTKWFRENIREPLRDSPDVLFATIAFRWFNTIETGELLRPYLLRGEWNREEIELELTRWRDAGKTIFTNAFMVNSAPGKPKHVDVLDNLELAWGLASDHYMLDQPGWTKEEMFNQLLRVPRLGNFAAYQVVVDLQYTYLLENAPDLNTFTVAGPGCAKGIGLCFDNDPSRYKYGSQADQEEMLKVMRNVRAMGLAQSDLWPSEWPELPLSDIENGFCEYAKWRTGHAGGRLKRRFKS